MRSAAALRSVLRGLQVDTKTGPLVSSGHAVRFPLVYAWSKRKDGVALR